MKFNKKPILLAVLAVSLPLAALAAGPVVPPPAAPGAAAAGPTLVAPPIAAAAANVIPPAPINSVKADAQATPAALIDIAIPAAPKMEPPQAVELRPTAPSSTKLKPVRAKKQENSSSETVVKKPADPFAGIVGTPVSDSQLNRFVFPEAIEGVFFQEGAPLPECPEGAKEMDPCKPVFLNGKRMMLLQLRAGAKGPVQMLVQTKSGHIITMNLMPTQGPGAVIRVDGAEDGASDSRLAAGRGSAGVPAEPGQGLHVSEQNVELMSRFARGDIPAGFESVAVASRPTRFELFEVIPQASWDNGAGLRAHLMQVRAYGDTPVALSPALFRHESVKSLALDRDTSTHKAPAMLYVLEQVPAENN